MELHRTNCSEHSRDCGTASGSLNWKKMQNCVCSDGHWWDKSYKVWALGLDKPVTSWAGHAMPTLHWLQATIPTTWRARKTLRNCKFSRSPNRNAKQPKEIKWCTWSNYHTLSRYVRNKWDEVCVCVCACSNMYICLWVYVCVRRLQQALASVTHKEIGHLLTSKLL